MISFYKILKWKCSNEQFFAGVSDCTLSLHYHHAEIVSLDILLDARSIQYFCLCIKRGLFAQGVMPGGLFSGGL